MAEKLWTEIIGSHSLKYYIAFYEKSLLTPGLAPWWSVPAAATGHSYH